MNIPIEYKWFYCVILQNGFSTISSERCGKQRLKDAAKLLSTCKQEQEVKKLYCKHKLVPKSQIATTSRTQGILKPLRVNHID